MGNLPRSASPKQRHAFSIGVDHGVPLRVDVTPNGAIRGMIAGLPPGSQAKVSGMMPLDGIIFPSRGAAVEPLQPSIGWSTYVDSDFAAPGFFKQGDLCVLSGVLRMRDWNIQNAATWNALLTTLPTACRPVDGRLIFNVDNDDNAHRVDVLPTGEVRWIIGKRSQPWISLSGIAFYTDSVKNPLPLFNGWQAFKKGYRVPSFKRQGQYCAVSGVAFVSTMIEHVATLPTSCRPNAELTFTVNHHDTQWRIDVRAR